MIDGGHRGAVGGVTAEEVLAAIDAVLPAGAADVRLATLDARASEPGIVSAAGRRGWPVTGYPAARLAEVVVPAPSGRVAALVGTPSVAEAAALLGGGSLVVGKTVFGRVTVAVTLSERADEPVAAATSGPGPTSAGEEPGPISVITATPNCRLACSTWRSTCGPGRPRRGCGPCCTRPWTPAPAIPTRPRLGPRWPPRTAGTRPRCC